MNVKREDKYLRLKADGIPTGGYEGPFRTVMGFDEVRQFLDEHLEKAEYEIRINRSVTRLMPYVLVLGTVDIFQEILPLSVNRKYFDISRKDVNNNEVWSSLEKIKNIIDKDLWVESLEEYNILGAGIFYEGNTEGIIFPANQCSRGNVPMDIIGEHYGTYTYSKFDLIFSGDTRDCFEGRGKISRKHAMLIAGMTPRDIVPLGPGDDIAGIVSGRYDYDDGWVKR